MQIFTNILYNIICEILGQNIRSFVLSDTDLGISYAGNEKSLKRYEKVRDTMKLKHWQWKKYSNNYILKRKSINAPMDMENRVGIDCGSGGWVGQGRAMRGNWDKPNRTTIKIFFK